MGLSSIVCSTGRDNGFLARAREAAAAIVFVCMLEMEE